MHRSIFYLIMSVIACAALPITAASETAQATTHAYHEVPGIPTELTSLDVYPANAETPATVVVFVHGGGWVTGDKAGVHRAPAFRKFFDTRELVLVSINYRLIGHELSPEANFRDQATDVAAAVRWVSDNIAEFGGDPGRIFLIGFSAGAQIVALVGTDERYLASQGLSRASLRGIVAWDVSAYDIPRAVREAPDLGVPGAPANLGRVFGADPDVQAEASAIKYVMPGQKYPPFLLVYVGVFDTTLAGALAQTLSKTQAEYLADALTTAGSYVRVYGEADRTHTSIGRQFGSDGDGITTETWKFIAHFMQ